MNTILRSQQFDHWLATLKDIRAKVRIARRIEQAQQGNFGDCEPVGQGISEMRIHVGAGYRIYFVRHEQVVYLLLCGGDKSSQQKDIQQAKLLKQQLLSVLKENHHD